MPAWRGGCRKQHLLDRSGATDDASVAAILPRRLGAEGHSASGRQRLVPVYGDIREVAEDSESVRREEHAPALFVVPVSDGAHDRLIRRPHGRRLSAHPQRRARREGGHLGTACAGGSDSAVAYRRVSRAHFKSKPRELLGLIDEWFTGDVDDELVGVAKQ